MSFPLHPFEGELFKALPDPVIVCDGDGGILWATDRLARLLGIPNDEIRGASLASLVTPRDRDSVLGLLAGGPRPEQDPLEADCSFVRADGSALPAHLRVSPCAHSDGTLSHVVVVGERHVAPAAPGKAAWSPEPGPGGSQGLLHLLSNSLRRTSNEIASEARLVGEKEVGADVHAMVSRIQAATTSLAGMTDLLVERWAIETGEIAGETIDFDLATTLSDIESKLVCMAQETGHTVATEFDPGLPRALKGDPTRLRQIVLTLARFLMTRTRGLTIHWRCQWERASSQSVRLGLFLEIEASHIAPEVLHQAFQPGGLPADPSGGFLEVGLGPYHARRLALLLGGDAGWESRPETQVLWAAITLERQQLKIPERARPDRGKVLVVSGSRKETDRWVESLRGRSWEAIGATTQEEALRLLEDSSHQDRPFRFAVVTLVLPDGSAEQVASRIFALAGQEGVHVLVVADVGRPGDAQWARGNGFSAYLVRPLSEKTLHEALAELERYSREHSGKTRGIFLTRRSLADKARSPLWVLVADDDELLCLSARAALEGLGHQVYVAENGELALELFDRARFDLILLDINMPGANGDQIAALLRSRERSSGQPPTAIIGISSDPRPDTRQRCLASGMNDLIPKPLDVDAIRSIVDSLKPDEALLRVWQPAQPAFAVKPRVGIDRHRPSLASLLGIAPEPTSAATGRDAGPPDEALPEAA